MGEEILDEKAVESARFDAVSRGTALARSFTTHYVAGDQSSPGAIQARGRHSIAGILETLEKSRSGLSAAVGRDLTELLNLGTENNG